jgi:phosphoribosylformylglycinamidine synthase subunit PurS
LSRFRVEVRIKPRQGLLDPEGKAIHHALESLGYEGVSGVRVGKLIDVEIDARTEKEAVARVDEMCRKLLANPVTESYRIEVVTPTEEPAAS